MTLCPRLCLNGDSNYWEDNLIHDTQLLLEFGVKVQFIPQSRIVLGVKNAKCGRNILIVKICIQACSGKKKTFFFAISKTFFIFAAQTHAFGGGNVTIYRKRRF